MGEEAEVSFPDGGVIVAELAIRPAASLFQTQRWDAEFFSPSVTALMQRLAECRSDPLGNFLRSAERGLAPAYDENGAVPVVRTANVRELEFSDVRQEYVSEDFFSSVSRGHIDPNDLVVTSTGIGTLGRTFCNIAAGTYFADGHLTVLKVNKSTDVCYLATVLQSRIGQMQFERWQRGSSGQIEIYPEDICSVLVPRLPRDIQTRISHLWRSAVERVQKSRELYPEAEQELLDRLGWQEIADRASELCFVEPYVEAMRAGRVDAERFQPRYRRLRDLLRARGAASVGELATEVAKGTQPSGYDNTGPIIVVKSKNVFGQGIALAGCERTSADAYEDIPARLRKGDVVMNSTGFGTLGRAAFIPEIAEKVVAAVDLLVLRMRREVLPEYLALFLNTSAGLWQSEMLQTGSSGQLHLYPQHVRDILVFLPRNKNGSIDIAWQRKLADKVTGASSAKREARAMLETAKKLVEDFVFNA